MERRLLLTGLAVLAATPALAQSTPAPATGATDPAPAAKMAPMAMATSAPMSDAQMAHAKNTATVGSLSLAVSQIALTKVKHPMLKQFAGFEVAEQETIADILKAMQMPDAKPMGGIKAPTEAELMANLDAKGKATVEKMRAMKAGPEFDRDYIKAQVEGHRMLLDIQETYLKVADNLDQTNVAKLAKGMIKEHLGLLGDLEKMG